MMKCALVHKIDISRWWIRTLELDNSSWMTRALQCLEIETCKQWIYEVKLDNSTWMASALELNTSVLEFRVRELQVEDQDLDTR